MKSCPRCRIDNITISDCGYSSFNIGKVECDDCRWSITTVCSCDPTKELEEYWNKIVKARRKIEKMLPSGAKTILLTLFDFKYRENNNSKFNEVADELFLKEK